MYKNIAIAVLAILLVGAVVWVMHERTQPAADAPKKKDPVKNPAPTNQQAPDALAVQEVKNTDVPDAAIFAAPGGGAVREPVV